MRWLARHVSLSRLIVVVIGLGVVASCKPRELPGKPIGVYRVVGTLEENSCGPTGLQLVNPLLFEVEIRDDEGVGIWALPQKPSIWGTIKRDGEFLFRLEDRYTLRPPSSEPEPDPEFLFDPDAYREPQDCLLSQVEVIEGTVATNENAHALDADVDADISLIGSDAIDIQPMSNSECLDALSSAGGPFATLPCRAVYTLEGQVSNE